MKPKDLYGSQSVTKKPKSLNCASCLYFRFFFFTAEQLCGTLYFILCLVVDFRFVLMVFLHDYILSHDSSYCRTFTCRCYLVGRRECLRRFSFNIYSFHTGQQIIHPRRVLTKQDDIFNYLCWPGTSPSITNIVRRQNKPNKAGYYLVNLCRVKHFSIP